MSATSSHENAPKSMSTRLLTMKFMQRASASQPSMAEEPIPKRRKTELDSSSPSRSTDNFATRNAVLDALASEEEKRQAALDRLASASGDTRWVLDYKDQNLSEPALSLRVVQTGYAGLDRPHITGTIDALEEKPTMAGRRSFGRFNKAIEKQQNPNYVESSDSNSTSDESDRGSLSDSESSDDDDDPLSQLIKTTRREVAENAKAEKKSNKRTVKSESEQPVKRRRKDEILKEDVNLKELTSLSGRQKAPSKPKIECYSCGGPHRKSECPKRKRGPLNGVDEPHRKISKLN
ncbi:hypothetical protein K3495_g8471 [Podosphaera aphanis]|nr:hypothetical protein K3495_g8471 [Podosphaera aphanis]